MNLKTSLFNKMIIKSDLKRHWWVSVLNTLAILIFGIYSQFGRYLLHDGYRYMPKVETTFWGSRMYGVLAICIPIIIAFCGFTAIMISLYLNSSNTVSFMHGLPLKRGTHYASHFLSGLILVISPAVLNAVILFFLRFNPILSQYIEVSHIFKWLYCYTVYALVVYSGTTFVTLLTGNAFAAIGVTGGIALLPLVLAGFISVFFEQNLYGYYDEGIMRWIEYVYLNPKMFFGWEVLIYVVLILALVIGTYFIYKKRHLENHGEVIAFPKLKPVFIYGVAVVAGFLGYLYCSAVTADASMWWILPFGLLGIIIAFMLSKKAFTLKGSLKPILIYTACFLVLFVVIKFDLTGFERRVPDISDIDGVTIVHRDRYENGEYTYIDSIGRVKYEENYYPIMTKKEDIQNMIDFHKFLIENRYDRKSNDAGMTIPIIYKLSNGRELIREYPVAYTSAVEYRKKLFETKEMKAYDFHITDGTKKEITNISVIDTRLKTEKYEVYENDKKLLNKLTEAFKKDVENLKYEDNYKRNRFVSDPLTYLTFKFIKPLEAPEGIELTEEQKNMGTRTETYSINENFVNTMQVLNEIGYFDNLPQKEDIKGVGLSFYDVNPVTGAVRNYDEVVKVTNPAFAEEFEAESFLKNYKYRVYDREKAWELYELVTKEAIYDTNYGNRHVTVAFVIGNKVFDRTLMYNEESFPEILKEILGE